MKHLLLLTFVLSATFVFGQTITDTVYYNSKGVKTTKDSYSYFRTITKVSKDLYEIKEYGQAGYLQMCGKLSKLDPEERQGEFKWYYDNGVVSKTISYEDNEIEGMIRAYNSAGELALEYILGLGCLDNGKMFERKIGEFTDFVSKTLKYPEKSEEEGVSGKVYTRFFIDTTGAVFSASVINSFNKDLDKEAIRVVSAYREWPIPYYKGKKCNAEFLIPITFTFQ